MEMNGLMGGFYKLSVLIMRFALTNVLWLLFNLPILYILVNLLFGEFVALKQGFLTIAILSPFIFFPSTTAMYGVIRKWIMGEDDIPLLRSFIKYYKENYKRSLQGGIFFALIWTSWFLNYLLFLQNQPIFFNIIYILLTAFLFTWTVYFFSFTVHFEMKLIPSLKSSFLLTIGNPFSSLSVALTNGVLLYISYKLTFLIPFFIGSLCVYCSFFYFIRVIKKAMKLQQPKDRALDS